MKRTLCQSSVFYWLPMFGVFALLLVSGVVFLCCIAAVHAKSNDPAGAIVVTDQRRLTRYRQAYRANQFDCLPKDVQLKEVVTYGRESNQDVSVEKKLMELRARCRNGKLVDAKKREIRFFRVTCWGNPPPDYREIQRREHEELKKLKKRYTVVVMACNPMIPRVRSSSSWFAPHTLIE